MIDANLLTVHEVAVLLSLSEQTVYRMVRAGKISGAIRIGSSWRFDPRRLDEGLFHGQFIGAEMDAP